MKCTKCNRVDPECGFYRKEKSCRECRNADHRAYYKNKYNNDPEFKATELQRSRDKAAITHRPYSKYREARYGMSSSAYEALVLQQEGRCAICKQINMKLNVDHDHITGAIRGLLCTSCNLMLGHAKDNTDNLQEGISYLLQSRNIDIDTDG